MNRNSEYKKLLKELENTPLKLDFTLERARARKSVRNKRRRVRKTIFIPLYTIAAVFVIFAALVNLSAPFAEACGRIPVLSELAEAVSLPKESGNHEIIGWNSYDADGNYYPLGGRNTIYGGNYYEHAGITIGSEDEFVEQITIYKDEYPYDEIWISTIFTDRTEFSAPLAVKIK